jgi:hypothetical protein
LPHGDAIVPNLVDVDDAVVVVAEFPLPSLELSLPLAAHAPATSVNATTMTANDRFIDFGPFSSESKFKQRTHGAAINGPVAVDPSGF